VIYDIEKKKEILRLQETDMMISGALTQDDKYLIVNVSYKQPEIHLWDLTTFELIKVFEGHKQENFIIRCAIGGFNGSQIACGAEGKLIKL